MRFCVITCCSSMRAIALLIWLFLNLGFFGMCGYIYLIWAQNWRASSRRIHDISPRSTYDPSDPVLFFDPLVAFENVSMRSDRTPRLSVVHRRKQKHNTEEDSKKKLQTLKNDILLRMRRVLHDESSVFKTDNPYHVNYHGPRVPLKGHSSEHVRCIFKRANLRTLTGADHPFDRLPLGTLLGNQDIFQGNTFKSCAIVSNAAALHGSASGTLIDSHDVVVRFNHAPTRNYQRDVGSKTDVRIVNSQVVTKPQFTFTTNNLYKNITVIVWDPSDYSASLEKWYSKPDFDFFKEWASFRQRNMDSSSGVVDPRSVWRVWNALQKLTLQRIRRNPPSSGFLGLVLMLSYCDYVDMFEFVPSIRMTDKCHYFDEMTDASCTLGVWHPLSAEKFIALAMNDVNDSTVFIDGFTRIRGFRDLEC